VKTRLFLTAWVVYSAHFSTNVVREHYPAFALVAHGTFRVDEYQGLHPDIFVHRDGHSYVGNNVASSVAAAVPLLVFDPVLNALEAHEKGRLANQAEAPRGDYRSPYPNSREFFRKVTERGLALRFGGATAVTSVFLMAPLSALCVVLVFQVLSDRGVPHGRALWLALLFAFATPVFFRTAHLSNNMFVMYATFAAFWLLWPGPGTAGPVSPWRQAAAGALAGFALACDYSGLVPLACLYGYLILRRRATAPLGRAVRESIPFVLGSIPPVAFLLFSQWAMYGYPFLPGQYWMPDVNYTDRGWRGFSRPRLDVFLLNLLHPSYGLVAFAPVLLLGLIPVARPGHGGLILPPAERRFTAVFVGLFLLFCSANQYSLMQWNCGFRYLLPVVPFLFLASCDLLARLRPGLLALVSVVAVGHVWVLCMARDCNPDLDTWRSAGSFGDWLQGVGGETVPVSYLRVWNEGPQLPWLRVLAQTSPQAQSFLGSPWLATAVLAACGALVAGVWAVRRPRLSPQARQARPCEGPEPVLG
jgi:hypothetical protein